MRKIKFSRIEKRIIIILMFINSLALFVNIFELTVTVYDKPYSRIKYYLFTDVGEAEIMQSGYDKMYNRFPSTNYNNFSSEFYPFVDFYIESKSEKRFRGIFAGFDHTEFMVYTFLIIGIPLIVKIW